MSKIIITLYILATSLALIFVKLGSKAGAAFQITDNKIHINPNPYILGGIFLYGISFLIYMFLISKYDLGYIIPVTTAFVYIIIFTASYFIFKEVFTAFKVVGIFLILGGIIFLNLPSK